MRRGLVLLMTCVFAAFSAASAHAQAKAENTPRAVLETYVAAWNQHDHAAFNKLLAPDGIHEDLAFGFHGQGPAQVKDFMKEVLKMEPDFVWKLTNVIESGNTVAAEWTWTATYTGDSPSGPVTAQHVTGRGATVAVIENGRIQRFSDYYDNASFFPKAPSGK